MQRKTLLLGLALATAPASCRNKQAATPDEVVATVNDHPITRPQFDQVVARNLARYTSQGKQLPPGITARIEESVLRRIIDDAIVEQKAQALGLALTDADVDTKFNEHKARFRTEQAFADYLQRSNNTEAALREDLRKNMLRDRVVDKLSGDIVVTDEDIAHYYAENSKHFVEPEQMRAHRILIPVATGAEAAQRRSAEHEAQKLHGQAVRPKADFLALARSHGRGPEASRDGDLGLLVPGRMPELDKLVVQGLKSGQISDVVRSEQGYAIFRLDEHQPARTKPLDEVRDGVRTSLQLRERNERRQAVLRRLKGDAKIDVRITFEAPPPPPAVPAAAQPTAPASATAPAGEPKP
jgi:parvulin-like peptidyl-prolyl isomerase